MVFRMYHVYRDYANQDDERGRTIRTAVVGENEGDARVQCMDGGEIVAIRDVTDDCQIDAIRIQKAMMENEFSEDERSFILRALFKTGVIV